jgi:hypothetical protein
VAVVRDKVSLLQIVGGEGGREGGGGGGGGGELSFQCLRPSTQTLERSF